MNCRIAELLSSFVGMKMAIWQVVITKQLIAKQTMENCKNHCVAVNTDENLAWCEMGDIICSTCSKVVIDKDVSNILARVYSKEVAEIVHRTMNGYQNYLAGRHSLEQLGIKAQAAQLFFLKDSGG